MNGGHPYDSCKDVPANSSKGLLIQKKNDSAMVNIPDWADGFATHLLYHCGVN
jgi:hypothetical protein